MGIRAQTCVSVDMGYNSRALAVAVSTAALLCGLVVLLAQSTDGAVELDAAGGVLGHSKQLAKLPWGKRIAVLKKLIRGKSAEGTSLASAKSAKTMEKKAMSKIAGILKNSQTVTAIAHSTEQAAMSGGGGVWKQLWESDSGHGPPKSARSVAQGLPRYAP